MERVVDSSAGRFVFSIPATGLRPASYLLFDAEGKEIGHAKGFPRLEIAWALTSFAELPEDEPHEIERPVGPGSTAVT